VGLPNKTVEGDSIVGYVYSSGGGLRFDRGYGFAISVLGVGLSVGLNLKSSTSSSLYSSASSELTKLLEAEYTRGYTDVTKKIRDFVEEL
jgi:hypothetical protein